MAASMNGSSFEGSASRFRKIRGEEPFFRILLFAPVPEEAFYYKTKQIGETKQIGGFAPVPGFLSEFTASESY